MSRGRADSRGRCPNSNDCSVSASLVDGVVCAFLRRGCNAAPLRTLTYYQKGCDCKIDIILSGNLDAIPPTSWSGILVGRLDDPQFVLSPSLPTDRLPDRPQRGTSRRRDFDDELDLEPDLDLELELRHQSQSTQSTETFCAPHVSPCPTDTPIPRHGTNMSGEAPQTALEASLPAMGGTSPSRTVIILDRAHATAQTGLMAS